MPADRGGVGEALAPGATLGILGGGQLGRMLALAAARLGLTSHIFDPDPAAPAAQVAAAHTAAGYDDAAALDAFAAAVDVVTYEFENIPTAALDRIEARVPIRPGRRALATSQDRLTEKEFLRSLGLATAPFAPLDGPDDAEAAARATGLPAILKTRRFGYDGKGQARVATVAEVAAAQARLDQPTVLEGFVDFRREVSVIAARGTDGTLAVYDPGENLHRHGILHTTTVPATMAPETMAAARDIAEAVLSALDYVGVIGVELFDTSEGLVVNEIAPRVHNSGHWTQNGAVTCQFEQHVRAVAGWPLGDPARHSDMVMTNLIGDEVEQALALAAEPGSALHLYGKAQARPGRKMGHVNRWTGPAARAPRP